MISGNNDRFRFDQYNYLLVAISKTNTNSVSTALVNTKDLIRGNNDGKLITGLNAAIMNRFKEQSYRVNSYHIRCPHICQQ